MKKIVVALLYIAFDNVPLLGQTLTPRPLTNPLVDRGRTVVDEVSTYTGCANQRSGCGDIEASQLRLPVPRHQVPFDQAMQDKPSQAAPFPAVCDNRAHAQARQIARRVPLTLDAPTTPGAQYQGGSGSVRPQGGRPPGSRTRWCSSPRKRAGRGPESTGPSPGDIYTRD